MAIHITSGSRCRKHDEATYLKLKKEWKGTSSHLPKGENGYTDAIDIKTTNSPHRFKVAQAAFKAGFTRIGFGDGFIHVDVDLFKADNVMWDYYKK